MNLSMRSMENPAVKGQIFQAKCTPQNKALNGGRTFMSSSLRDRHMSDPERLNGAADGEARTTLDIGMPTSTVNI